MDLTAFMTVADYERAAGASLDRAGWAYLAGGAGEERAVHANIAAYDEFWFRPRIFSDAGSRPDTAVSLFGQRLSLPVILAPTSPQRILHEEAELATARAAKRAGTVSVVSSDSHFPFPRIAEAGGTACWFQVYPYRSHAHIDKMIAMAEETGARGIVLTVDAYHRPQRVTARRAGFRVPPEVDFGTLRLLGILDGEVPPDARIDRIPLGWGDLDRIRARVQLPLLVKGVLRAEDARRCVDAGVDGVVVSNHGGRQLDCVTPALPALAAIAAEVGDECTLLVDGGIRSGGDVVKALALGANAVCVGRPYLWGLRVAGQAGVEAVLATFRREITDVLLQLGLASVSEVRRDCVWSAPLENKGIR
ncbi:alpha-hydroxy acid oxidase [Amycolatopsis pigmentata]|uniref:Alpha-hydroxy acid oxidase n=1 Tax=Amycolatopsis pigmentata TaxID=450801 RepID=A0ABW5FPS6_9PSEU